MRLNPDCIRDLLLSFEEITDGVQNYSIPDWEDFEFDYVEAFPLLSKYPRKEIACHVRQCVENGFLLDAKLPCDGGLEFSDLSPKGHEFLNNIRAEKNWEKTKRVCARIGKFSLGEIAGVAKSLAVATLTKRFGL